MSMKNKEIYYTVWNTLLHSILRKTVFYFVINIKAWAKNKNRKVNIFSAGFLCPSHVPESKYWTRWHVTSCCSHNPNMPVPSRVSEILWWSIKCTGWTMTVLQYIHLLMKMCARVFSLILTCAWCWLIDKPKCCTSDNQHCSVWLWVMVILFIWHT